MNAQALYNPVKHETFASSTLLDDKLHDGRSPQFLSSATLHAVSTPVDTALGLSPISSTAHSNLGAQFDEHPGRTVHTYQLVIAHDEHGSYTKFEPKLSVGDAQLLARTIRSSAAGYAYEQSEARSNRTKAITDLKVDTSGAQLRGLEKAQHYNHAERDLGAPRLKRKRAPTPPPTPQSADGHPRSDRGLESPTYTGSRATVTDDPIESYLNEYKIDVTDRLAVTELLECLFDILHQGICRSLAKVIIKAIEPDKQSAHPYRREAQKAVLKLRSDAGLEGSPRPIRTPEWSTWWPDEVTYKGETIPMLFIEPDHLHKSCRVSLLIHMLRLPQTSKEYYENMCQQDIALHGERSWTNWGEWLARRIDQIELGEKPNRRNRNGLDINKVRDANDLKSARKAVLRIIFEIIASEEASLHNSHSDITQHVRFTIPPLLHKAYRKFQFETKQASLSTPQESFQGHVRFGNSDCDAPQSKMRLLHSPNSTESPKTPCEISPDSAEKSSRCSTEELTDGQMGKVKHSSICLARAVSSQEDLLVGGIAWNETGHIPPSQSFVSVDSGYDSPHTLFPADQVDSQFHFGQSTTFDCNKVWDTSAAPVAVGLNVQVAVFDHQPSQWDSEFSTPNYGTSGASLAPAISLAQDMRTASNIPFTQGRVEQSSPSHPEFYRGLCDYGPTTIAPAMTNVSYCSSMSNVARWPNSRSP